MRRRALLGLILACSLVAARSQARAPLQGDVVAALLADLQTALQAGRVAEFARASAPSLSPADLRRLESLVNAEVRTVVVRQRAREAESVLAEVFISYGGTGRVATWLIGVGAGREPGRAEMTSVREVSSFADLVRLEIDATRQFTLRDFSFTGFDFVLTMSSGTAFTADAPGGMTAIVLRGRGRVRFSPPDPTEQGQLRIFAGRPDFAADVNDVFIRLNPDEFSRRIKTAAFEPAPVDPAELRRAREIFDVAAPRSYQVSLGDLSVERWSVLPPPGGALVDFRTNRFGWLSYGASPEQAEDIAFFDRARGRQMSVYASLDHRQRFGPFYDDGADVAYEVQRTSLDLNFDPARFWFSGRADLRLKLLRPVQALRLRLDDALAVSSVSSPELGQLLALRVPGLHTLVVGLPVNAAAGQEITLSVQYSGRLDPQPLGREAILASPQDPSSRERDTSMANSIEPRFLYSARSAWHPQTGLARHAPASIRLTVPADYHPVATGRLVSTTLSEAVPAVFGARVRQARTVEYRADVPIRYPAFLVSRFVPAGAVAAPVARTTGESGNASVDVQVVMSPMLTNRRRASPDTIAAMVSFFGRLFGDAPYPSLTVAALEDMQPGGHSPAGFVMINLPHPTAPLSWSNDPVWFADAPNFFLAHEVAHQWWGQAVGAKSYHEVWTSEGFAQYLAWLYVEATDGRESAQRIMTRMRQTALNYGGDGPIHLGNRIGHLRSDARSFRAIVYNKSAIVLHMLRRLIGDQAFFDGLVRLYRGSRFRSIGTDDVERAFQAGTAVELDTFFERWVLAADVPTVRLSWTAREGAVTVRVEQTAGASVFPLDVALEFADGTRQRHTMRIDAPTEEATWPARGPVRRVVIDDDVTLVRLES